MRPAIKAIEYYLPENTLSNEDLSELFPFLNDADIYKKTGIRNRHITSPGIVGSDLAFFAAEKLFSEQKIDRSKIDFLIFCTEGLDYKGPATACVLQDRLGLSTSCGAIDLPYGCTGFAYCLSIAKVLVESGQAKEVLVLTADIPSTVIHPGDHELRMIFGDAGAATIVGTAEGEGTIGNFSFGTDGSGAPNLIVKHSGTRGPADKEWIEENKDAGGMLYGRMEMNSIEIFNFTLKTVPKLVADILSKNNMKQEDIDLFVFHQANAFLLSVLRRKIKIDENKFFVCMENTGNTVSATIPIALSEAIRSGRAKKGDRILLAAFGIGYSWAGTVITL
jgi:3-oxoacyl-[acyl-carrier-protein] synthase III